MEHPAFAEAGSEPGIEIWTIDQFEPVAVDKKLYGKFYNGDCYIVLKTSGTSGSSLSYDAHFWLGANATQDKKGAAAILTVSLDDSLSGAAVHHREVQKHESSQFLGYFKPAIRYLEGGNESGFNAVETNAGAEKRLLRLSGCDNMRIEEVPAEASSLTKENCFILEVDHDIFVLMPEGARATQRRKIIAVANQLRDEEHNGRATIDIIDEFSSDFDFAAFFDALGSGSRDDIGEEQTAETYSRESATSVYLYKVVYGDEIELEDMKKPYKQKNLSSEDIYILDTPCSGVYIWFGADVDKDIRKKYNDIVQQFLDIKGYPAWVNVTKVLQGGESGNFRQYFHSWDTVSANKNLSESDAGYFSADADESAASAYMIGKSAPARSFMPDEGEGNLVIMRIAGDKEDITEKIQSGVSVLYQTEVYVVNYQFTNSSGDEAHVVYVWTGKEASDDDKQTALEVVSEIDGDDESVAIVSIPQGREIKHFLSIFKGNLAILFGGKDNDYAPVNSKGTYEEDSIRLFRVEGTELGKDMRAVQVEESSAVLEDDDVFVLETADVVYVRNGKESTAKEQEAALTFVNQIVGDAKEVSAFDQGDEPEEFWTALGEEPEDTEGDKSGWRNAVNRRVATPPSLTSATVRVNGKINFEELPGEFNQEDLSDDGIYILDAGEEIYMWQGKNVTERAKKVRARIIQEYIEDDGLDRTPETMIVVNIKQGAEPNVFKNMFPSWADDLWENQTSYEDLKNEAKAPRDE